VVFLKDDLQWRKPSLTGLPFVCGDVRWRRYRWRWGTDGFRYRPNNRIEIATAIGLAMTDSFCVTPSMPLRASVPARGKYATYPIKTCVFPPSGKKTNFFAKAAYINTDTPE